ncbi:MAG: hypothetical protein K0R38_2858 [Polyangiaceae bacterium]|jgi:8-oxo-dGTP pyrophosphatase MutT (NUDIX family)|nr:hypothetical protein [Polyangiaceae bacterium]
MLDADEILREALALPDDEKRYVAQELRKSLGSAPTLRDQVPWHPLIPDEGLLIRRSLIAYIVVKLRIGDEDCLLLNIHRKWGDWTFPGGHVEPYDADFRAAAVREAMEELAPLRPGEHFEIAPEPLASPEWGPVASPTHFGVATRYQSAFFSLQFKKPPTDCLPWLPPGEFRFHPMSNVLERRDVGNVVKVLRYDLATNWSSIPLSWSDPLEIDPLRRRC